jgi:hypothetical protein
LRVSTGLFSVETAVERALRAAYCACRMRAATGVRGAMATAPLAPCPCRPAKVAGAQLQASLNEFHIGRGHIAREPPRVDSKQPPLRMVCNFQLLAFSDRQEALILTWVGKQHHHSPRGTNQESLRQRGQVTEGGPL